MGLDFGRIFHLGRCVNQNDGDFSVSVKGARHHVVNSGVSFAVGGGGYSCSRRQQFWLTPLSAAEPENATGVACSHPPISGSNFCLFRCSISGQCERRVRRVLRLLGARHRGRRALDVRGAGRLPRGGRAPRRRAAPAARSTQHAQRSQQPLAQNRTELRRTLVHATVLALSSTSTSTLGNTMAASVLIIWWPSMGAFLLYHQKVVRVVEGLTDLVRDNGLNYFPNKVSQKWRRWWQKKKKRKEKCAKRSRRLLEWKTRVSLTTVKTSLARTWQVSSGYIVLRLLALGTCAVNQSVGQNRKSTNGHFSVI